MQSRARQIYSQIVENDNPAIFLESMVLGRKTESEFLEFKGGQVEKNERDIKRIWSETLSAFANTEGGVVIWGIETAKVQHPVAKSQRIDAASELKLLSDPFAFEQLLRSVLLEAIEPAHPAEIIAIPHRESGFVVCFIEEGKQKPYRASLDPSAQYYQRVNDNSVRISHSLLRSLFYPHLAPTLSFSMKPSLDGTTLRRITIEATIHNNGTSTAREVLVNTAVNRDASFEPSGFPVKHYGTESGSGATYSTFELKQNLHHGQSQVVFRIRWHISEGDMLPGRLFLIPIRVYCLDQEFTDFELQYSYDQLMTGYRRFGKAQEQGSFMSRMLEFERIANQME